MASTRGGEEGSGRQCIGYGNRGPAEGFVVLPSGVSDRGTHRQAPVG